MNAAPDVVHPKNNFDFLRIGAAYMVLFSHQYSLTGQPQPALGGYQTLGGLALNIFFTISGFLVVQSWEQDPHPLRFAARRFLRIWPGLAAMGLVVVLVWAPLLTTVDLKAYFTDPQTRKFLSLLWLSFEYRLPGVFASNPLPFINGSLWTLAVEARWYLFLLIFGVLGLVRFRIALLAIWMMMAVNYFFLYDVENVTRHGGDRWWNTELGLFFMSGLCLYRFRDVWQPRAMGSLAVLGLLCVGLFLAHYRYASFTLATAAMVIAFGCRSTPYLRQAGRFGDPSYGVYIYAFLVQQTVIALTGNALGIALGFMVSAAVTALVGFASWHLVEQPALRLKTRLHRPPRVETASG